MSSINTPAFALSSPLPSNRAGRRHSRPTCPQMCDTPKRPAFRSADTRAKDFLTQRAVQQTMFCSRVLRDETTVRWLEDWLGHHGLDDLHHCDALRVASAEYLTRLFKEPPVVLVVKKPIPGRTTRDNPYIKRRYFTYDVEIVPRKIGMRVLEARKQIAEELVADIPCIASENRRLLSLYRTRLLSNDPAPLTKDMLTLQSNGDSRGSPYRTANFDLVKNYTLYLGLCDARRELARRTEAREDADWLTEFLRKHGRELLQPYGGARGSADAVVEALLMTPPSIRERSGTLFDPGLLAEKVLQLRAECADVWLRVMEEADDDQLNLERRLLEEGL